MLYIFYMKNFKCIVWIECELCCDCDKCQIFKLQQNHITA